MSMLGFLYHQRTQRPIKTQISNQNGGRVCLWSGFEAALKDCVDGCWWLWLPGKTTSTVTMRCSAEGVDGLLLLLAELSSLE